MSTKNSKNPFTQADVERMVAHMNEDHTDSVLAYVQHFGERPEASQARLLDITPSKMRIQARTPSGSETLVIAFDHQLVSSHDAHMTMVKMSKTAKRCLSPSEPDTAGHD